MDWKVWKYVESQGPYELKKFIEINKLLIIINIKTQYLKWGLNDIFYKT